MLAPAVVLLLGWMLVPLIMTLYFSFLKRYLPLRGGDMGWIGFDNYEFASSPIRLLARSVRRHAALVGGVLVITSPWGVLLALCSISRCGARDRAHPGDRALLRHAHRSRRWSGRTCSWTR